MSLSAHLLIHVRECADRSKKNPKFYENLIFYSVPKSSQVLPVRAIKSFLMYIEKGCTSQENIDLVRNNWSLQILHSILNSLFLSEPRSRCHSITITHFWFIIKTFRLLRHRGLAKMVKRSTLVVDSQTIKTLHSFIVLSNWSNATSPRKCLKLANRLRILNLNLILVIFIVNGRSGFIIL